MELRRVFALVTDCHSAIGHYGTVWRRHFYDGLRGAGPEVVLPRDLDLTWAREPGLGEAERGRRRGEASDCLGEQIRQAREARGLDAVISSCFSADLDLGLVADTVASGVPWVNFYCDGTHRFPEVEALARVASLNWFPERAALPRYRGLGARHLCRPYALNPAELPDLGGGEPRRLVGFVGVPSGNRVTRLGLLRLLGVEVEVRGHGWDATGRPPLLGQAREARGLWRVLTGPGLPEKALRRSLWPLVRRQARGPLSDTELFAFVRECQVVLGLNQARDEQGRLGGYLKLRDLEFPGYGRCYLTEWNEDLAEVFDVGREVLAFRGVREAAEHLRRAQREPERALEVGRAGRARVLAEHTWATRLPELAAAL